MQDAALARASDEGQRVERNACVFLLVSHGQTASPPEWVHVLPAGTFFGRDGRGPFTLRDPDTLIRRFRANAVDLPVDYEHQSLDGHAKTGPVPAAGWIKELDAREDGIWARVEWTDRATELLMQREYRFLSPVFRASPNGEIVEILSVGLVHSPNLHLTAVAASRAEARDVQEETDRMAWPEPLAEALGIQADADEATVVAAARALKERSTPDPREWVPMAHHRAVADELAALKERIETEKAKAAVDDGIAAGKIAPALREWAMSYALKDADGFRAFLAAAPVVLPQDEPIAAARNAHSDFDALIVAAENEMKRAADAGRPIRFADAVAMVRRKENR